MATAAPGKRRHTGQWLATVALGLAPTIASGATLDPPDEPRPDRFQCVGRNHFSGEVNLPVEKHGDSDAWPYAAYFIDPVHGTPIIVYGPRFRMVGALMQAFIRRHECQHANGEMDEIAANCAALVQMRAQGLTPQQEAQLERWHVGQGRLDPHYGGSGAAFWARTVHCAALAR